MQEENREGISGALKTLAAVVIVFLLLAALYVGYQAMQVLFPPNTYETALLATVEDTVDAEGVLLFEESYVAGGGTLGYLVADGERVSAGTAVAEIYSDAAQASLRQQLTQINDQIDLLQRSQNTTSVQLESLRKNRSAALYDLMDSLDAGDYEDTDEEKENYILAQNKLWVITGEVASFSDQITALTQQAATVQSQLAIFPDHGPADGLFHPQLQLRAAERRFCRYPCPGCSQPESLRRILPGDRAGRLRGKDRFGLYLVLCRGVLGQTGGKAAGQGRQALDQGR